MYFINEFSIKLSQLFTINIYTYLLPYIYFNYQLHSPTQTQLIISKVHPLLNISLH